MYGVRLTCKLKGRDCNMQVRQNERSVAAGGIHLAYDDTLFCIFSSSADLMFHFNCLCGWIALLTSRAHLK